MQDNNLLSAVSVLSKPPANNIAEHSTQISAGFNAQKLMHEAQIVGECYRVRVLFDTEHLKNDKDYIAIIEDTWLRTFKDTDPELLAEAVQNFIISDKKGYLPKPGQIVEFLVKEIKDIKQQRYWAEIEMLEHKQLIEKYGKHD